MRTVLVSRLDSCGDVLLAGPAIRAIARRAEVVLLTSPTGAPAAGLLPGVSRLVVWDCPWVTIPSPGWRDEDVSDAIRRLAQVGADEAVILTSWHQSPLPLAVLLRQAGIPRVSAISEDHAGALLDVRHRVPDGIPEAARGLSLAAAAGYPGEPSDGDLLQVVRPLPDTTRLTGPGPYVVLHPGASAPSRTWPAERWLEVAEVLRGRGRRVVVTGGRRERLLTAFVADRHGVDLGGRTGLAELADVLDRADSVVVGNTGPAHLAAAVRTPVVSLFAPVVPAAAWAPHGVPSVVLGDQAAPCAGTGARTCPVEGHPCLTRVTAGDVLQALDRLERVAA